MSDKLDDVRGGYYPIGVFPEGNDAAGKPLGELRYVRYDLNAFAEMERIYGSMDSANAALTKGSMTDVRRILWLGLIHDQAILDEITGEPISYKLKMYDVGKWLTPTNMRTVMDKLNAAISGSVPEDVKNGVTNAAGVTPAQAAALAKAEEEAAAEDKQPAIINFPTKVDANNPNAVSRPAPGGTGPSTTI
jgi:DNA-directed RNA polymerase